MTPAAFALAKRTLDGDTGAQERDIVFGLLRDSHFFEVTEVMQLAIDLSQKMAEAAFAAGDPPSQAFLEGLRRQLRRAFLPAPKTWIEWKHADGYRIFYVCSENGWQCYLLDVDGALTTTETGFVGWWDVSDDDVQEATNTLLRSVLMLINTPRLIGRRSHECHKGLARKLRKDKTPSKFPLQGWTEIKLEVSKPVMIGAEPSEKRLTGSKCLHWCRRHLRVFWDGGWTIVTDHWRGNEAFGIKQSRYVVQ